MSVNILIVDDAIFMRKILKTLVEDKGYNVVGTLDNGKKAVELYEDLKGTENEPQIILMDITMPEMDGITALKELKKINKDIAVVMCSSLTSQHSVIKALHEGAKHFISKPFKNQDVLKTLEKVVKKL